MPRRNFAVGAGRAPVRGGADDRGGGPRLDRRQRGELGAGLALRPGRDEARARGRRGDRRGVLDGQRADADCARQRWGVGGGLGGGGETIIGSGYDVPFSIGRYFVERYV